MITIIRERCQEHFNLGRSVNFSLPRNCFREMAYQIIFEIDPALPFFIFWTSVPSNEMALGHIRDEWINIKIPFSDIPLF